MIRKGYLAILFFQPGRVRDLTSSLDILPTLLSLIGHGTGIETHGFDLSSLLLQNKKVRFFNTGHCVVVLQHFKGLFFFEQCDRGTDGSLNNVTQGRTERRTDGRKDCDRAGSAITNWR